MVGAACCCEDEEHDEVARCQYGGTPEGTETGIKTSQTGRVSASHARKGRAIDRVRRCQYSSGPELLKRLFRQCDSGYCSPTVLATIDVLGQTLKLKELGCL